LNKKSTIEINVELDEENIPEKISWSADHAGIKDQSSKALLLSVWDSSNKEALKMDLWTKKMPVDEMKLFFHQTLYSLAETYKIATNDEKMAAAMHDFCDYFAEKNELID
jgi:gliding motility-associated protein GldC